MEIQEEANESIDLNKGETSTPASIFSLPFATPINQFSFQFLRNSFDSIDKSAEIREQLLQYNLITSDSSNLQIFTYRFHGLFNSQLLSDYELLLKELFQQHEVLRTVGITGEAETPFQIIHSPIGLNTLAMDFFDRLYQSAVITPDGRIRGCFDETFNGVTVGDLLRELMVNEDSENHYLFKEQERQELIYQLFQTVVIGGSLCQPDTHIDRYLSITKTLYKELVTVYKDSKTQEVKVSGKAFEIKEIKGLELFSGRHNSAYSHLYVIVDPMKKNLTILKNTFIDFW